MGMFDVNPEIDNEGRLRTKRYEKRDDFNFKSSLDIVVYIQCKPKDVQSLQSSYVLVFYHFGFETTTLTFSSIFWNFFLT
jgi:hypothetical protein